MILRSAITFLLAGTLVASAEPRRSLLDSDPDVVYLEEHLDKPIELRVIKEAPIFSDKDGKRKLGSIVTGQKVVLQAMTERAYRISAKTTGNRVVGWVAPWAFASKDPDFVENLKKLYNRQLEVARLIDENRVAIGMTLEEVGKSLGSPTKTKVRQTEKGRSGSWEFVAYEEVPHYTYIKDPVTGKIYRQLSHVTKEETGKTLVEFENDVVTAIEESENRAGGGQVKIVVPPVVFLW
ncbi:hypothetical protein HAHE_23090 [Haloferula helveola]|uniref:SH3 domain-containing protein n=1 Tax=Haloferula helveola TaxID=490095 RepID=A0ABM7RMM1_9BACT|nr:hypothetical protein HAHE_23090 [Haloferula helveola]